MATFAIGDNRTPAEPGRYSHPHEGHEWQPGHSGQPATMWWVCLLSSSRLIRYDDNNYASIEKVRDAVATLEKCIASSAVDDEEAAAVAARIAARIELSSISTINTWADAFVHGKPWAIEKKRVWDQYKNRSMADDMDRALWNAQYSKAQDEKASKEWEEREKLIRQEEKDRLEREAVKTEARAKAKAKAKARLEARRSCEYM